MENMVKKFLPAFLLFFLTQCLFAAGWSGQIRAALSTVDQLAAESKKNPADSDLAVLKNIFFQDDAPQEEALRSYIAGCLTPDILELVYGKEGKYPHHGDTNFFYTLLLAIAGKQGTGDVVNENNVAFALGCIAHLVTDKYTHPVVNKFAGNVYGEAAAHEVVKFELEKGDGTTSFPGKYVRKADGTGELYKPDGGENKKRYNFFEYWADKEILRRKNINSTNTTPELADDLKRYQLTDFRPLTYSQIDCIMETYRQLWNAGSYEGVNPLQIMKKAESLAVVLSLFSTCHTGNQVLERETFLKALNLIVPGPATDILPCPAVILPNSNLLDYFLGDLKVLCTTGDVDYANMMEYYIFQVETTAPAECIAVFKYIAPYCKDKILKTLLIEDTKIENIDLYTGKLAKGKSYTSFSIPAVHTNVNPEQNKVVVANKGANTIKVAEIKDKKLIPFPSPGAGTITVEQNPQSVCLDSTGRFGWVGNGNQNLSWIDTFTDTEIDQDGRDPTLTRLRADADTYALAYTPDNSRLFAVHKAQHSVSVIDTKKRQVEDTITIPDCTEAIDIVIDAKGEYAYILVKKTVGKNSDCGAVVQIDIRKELLSGYNKVQNNGFYNRISNTLDLNEGLCKNPRAMAINPASTALYITDYAYYRQRSYIHVVTNLPTMDPADSIFPYVGGPGDNRRRFELINVDIIIAPLLVAPYVVETLASINPPPGIYTKLTGYNELSYMMNSMVGLSMFGGGTAALSLLTIPQPIMNFYYFDPIELNFGTGIALPPVRYAQYSSVPELAYASFWYTGNVGFLDTKEAHFLAGTRSLLDDSYMGRKIFNRNTGMAASMTGDILLLDSTHNSMAFYSGERLFQSLAETKQEDLNLHPLAVNPYPNLSLVELNSPVAADIQPVVYLARPMTGRNTFEKSDNKVELDFIFFSRQDIDNIKIYCGKESTTEIAIDGNNAEWAQKHPRQWELILRLGDKTPGALRWASSAQDIIYDFKFEVKLKSGAIVTLNAYPFASTRKVKNPPFTVDIDLEGLGEDNEETMGDFLPVNTVKTLTIQPVGPPAIYSGSVTLTVTEEMLGKIRILELNDQNLLSEVQPPLKVPTSELPKRYFIEGEAVSSRYKDIEIKGAYTANDETKEDKIRVTVYQVDLVIDSDNDDVIEATDDQIEDSAPGCILPVSLAGDTGEGEETREWLEPFRYVVTPLLPDTEIKFTVSENLKIWTDLNEVSRITGRPLTDLLAEPNTYYADGLSAGPAEIKLIYKFIDKADGKQGKKIGEDKVKLYVTDPPSRAAGKNNTVYIWSALPSRGEADAQALQAQLENQGFNVVWFRDTSPADTDFESCTFNNYSNLPECGILMVLSDGEPGGHYAVYAEDSPAGSAAIDAWIGATDGITKVYKPGEYYAARVSADWFTANWQQPLNTGRCLVIWAVACSAQASAETGEQAIMEAAGGRWRIGYTEPADEEQRYAVIREFFGNLNGTLNSGTRRTTGQAYDSGLGYPETAVMRGNDWTTICPAPIGRESENERACYPLPDTQARKGWGCIIFDTYMKDTLYPGNVLAKSSGGEIGDIAWAGNRWGSFILGFTYSENLAEETTLRITGKNCASAGVEDARRLDGDRVAPNDTDNNPENVEWKF